MTILTQGLELLKRAAGSARGRWTLLLLSLLLSLRHSQLPQIDRHLQTWEHEEGDSPLKPDLGIF